MKTTNGIIIYKPILTFIASILCFTSYAQHNTYYIGHSGFGFSQLNLVGAMVDDLAADAGISTYDYGDQIIGGRCLSYQWENPGSSLTGHSHNNINAGNVSGMYDIIVTTDLIPITEALDPNLAPWTGCNISPYEALDNYHDLAVNANANTIFYLMEFHNEADFTVGPPNIVFNNWVALNASTRPLWEHVADSVSQINNGAQICIIPVAAASEALADSIMNNNFPGITNFIDLFEPTDGASWKIHYTDVTTYLSACVHFATLFHQSPIGLTNELAGRTVMAGTAPTPAQALIMQQIAWEIVTNDSRALNCGLTTHTEDMLHEKDNGGEIIQAYPNPTSGSFQLKGIESIDWTLLTIKDVSGKTIFSTTTSQFKNDATTINIDHSGIYFLQILNNNTLVSSSKFIVTE